MSLAARLLGFGLCLIGAFTVGYVEGIDSVAGSINNVVSFFAGGVPEFGTAVAASATAYLQQTVTPTLDYYLAVGVVIVVGGFILVARGDRKPSTPEKELPIASDHLSEKT